MLFIIIILIAVFFFFNMKGFSGVRRVYSFWISSELWQSHSGDRTAWRGFLSCSPSIISSVRHAASCTLLPNPTWAEAKPICQAWSHPETNCSASPLWSPVRQPAMGGQQGCYWFLTLHRTREAEKETIRYTLIHADGAYGQALLGSCEQQSNGNLGETINSKEM